MAAILMESGRLMQEFAPEVEKILERIGVELTAILAADELATISIFCNIKSTAIKVERELEPFERKMKPKGPARKSWG